MVFGGIFFQLRGCAVGWSLGYSVSCFFLFFLFVFYAVSFLVWSGCGFLFSFFFFVFFL
ncbi:hypothetical protein FN846DRAFT_945464, partial [Sphaerosporella brunnea]